MLVITSAAGTLLLYTVTNLSSAGQQTGTFNQIDSKIQQLKRDSAELFIKETIPKLTLTLAAEVPLYVPITCISCITNSQMMIATRSNKILRYRWDGNEERDFSLDLQRIPFSINQQVSYAVPIVDKDIYVTSMDYSPLVGGFAITLSDGRAAFLTANDLRFDPNVSTMRKRFCLYIHINAISLPFSKCRASGHSKLKTPVAPASTTSTV